MSEYRLGDIVSLSRAQTVVIQVLAAPDPDEEFSVVLPINGVPTEFSFIADGGETIPEATIDLVDTLSNAQTVYSVSLVDEDDGLFSIVGPIAAAFDFSITSNLEEVSLEQAVDTVGPDGLTVGPLKVLVSTNLLGYPPREFVTRYVMHGDSVMLSVNRISTREINTGNLFDIDATQILTVIEAAI